jgi:hypothetical protein
VDPALDKKKKTTNIKNSLDINITKNFTCKFWPWIKEKIWVAPPRSKSKYAPEIIKPKNLTYISLVPSELFTSSKCCRSRPVPLRLMPGYVSGRPSRILATKLKIRIPYVPYFTESSRIWIKCPGVPTQV